MKISKWLRFFLIGGMVAAAALRAEDNDDATQRRKAMDEFYNESYGRDPRVRGPWTAAYRKFMLETAARERVRWANKMPGARAAAGASWVNIGPTNAVYSPTLGVRKLHEVDSGRLRDIVPHPDNPNILYLATAAGGVWKSTNKGSSWAPITETLGSLSIGSLAMDMVEADTLYLGLGDPFGGTGVGIVKTVDGGATWNAPVFLGDSTVTSDLIVSPNNRNIVLATTDKGIYRSTDAGATWTLVTLATGQSELPYGWSIASTGGANFVLALEALSSATTGSTDGQIWWSGDDGASWTQSTGLTKSSGIGRATVAASKSNPAIVYALAAIPNSAQTSDLADLFKSTDGGKTWTALNANTKAFTNPNRDLTNVADILNGQGWYNQLLIVKPTDPNTLYFGGALAMGSSTDGGLTFSQVSNWLGQYGLPYIHADLHAAAYDKDGIFYIGSDGGIANSGDGGVTWSSKLNVGITSHLLYSVCSSPNNADAVGGGMQDNGFRIRSGTTTTYNETILGDGLACNINPSNANLVLGGMPFENILKSTDGGLTFKKACNGFKECGHTNQNFTRLVPWAGDPSGNTIYTLGTGKLYKTTDYADTWVALGTNGLAQVRLFVRGIGVFKGNSNVVGLVANQNRIYLTTDGGTNWTQTPVPPNSAASLSSIWFDETNASIVYVASVAPDSTSSHIWRSADFGATWTAIDGGGFPFGIPVYLLRTDPKANTTLYACTDLGLYQSTDSGATWTRFGTGLPLVEVWDLYISPDSKIMRLGTFGRGFWELR